MGTLSHLRRRVALFVCPELVTSRCRLMVLNSSGAEVDTIFDAVNNAYTVTIAAPETSKRALKFNLSDHAKYGMARKGVVRS